MEVNNIINLDISKEIYKFIIKETLSMLSINLKKARIIYMRNNLSSLFHPQNQSIR